MNPRPPFQCDHPIESRALRRKGDVAGRFMVGLQCIVCGGLVGSWKKLTQVGDVRALDKWDEGLGESWRRSENARVKEYRASLLAERGVVGFARTREPEPNFWEKYGPYLSSPEWRDKRRRVLERAGGLCEGCRAAPATQVHHLTYRRVGKEMLFDLVAVCDDCHDLIHGH